MYVESEMKHVYEECDPEKLSLLFEVLDLTGNTQVSFICFNFMSIVYIIAVTVYCWLYMYKRYELWNSTTSHPLLPSLNFCIVLCKSIHMQPNSSAVPTIEFFENSSGWVQIWCSKGCFWHCYPSCAHWWGWYLFPCSTVNVENVSMLRIVSSGSQWRWRWVISKAFSCTMQSKILIPLSTIE